MVTQRQADAGLLRRAAEVLQHYDFPKLATSVREAVEAMGGPKAASNGEPGALEISGAIEAAIRHAISAQWLGVAPNVLDSIIERINNEIGGVLMSPEIAERMKQVPRWREDAASRILHGRILAMVREATDPSTPDIGPIVLAERLMSAVWKVYGEPPEGAEFETVTSDTLAHEVGRLQSVLRRIKGMGAAGEWISGDGLSRYIDYHLSPEPDAPRTVKEPW